MWWLMLLAMGAQPVEGRAVLAAAAVQQERPPVMMAPLAARPPPAPMPPTYRPTPGEPLPIIGPDATPLPRPPLDLAIVKQPDLAGFYPQDLRRAGVEGGSRIDLMLDAAGRVTACQARSISTDAVLDKAACKFGLKLRFTRTGKRYPLPLPLKIEWRKDGPILVRAVRPKLPVLRVAGLIGSDDYPVMARRAGVQGTSVVVLTVSEGGRVARCQIVSTSGSDELDRATCAILSRRARPFPALDEFGVPVSGRISEKARWTIDDDPPATDTSAKAASKYALE